MKIAMMKEIQSGNHKMYIPRVRFQKDIRKGLLGLRILNARERISTIEKN